MRRRTQTGTESVDRAMDEILGLEPGRRKPRAEGSGARGRSWVGRALRWVAVGVAAAVLPFLTLIRVSVEMYQRYGAPAWIALAVGVLATIALLTAYVYIVRYRIFRRLKPSATWVKGVAVLVVAFCFYCLAYIGAANVKTPGVRNTYSTLHPLLRVAVTSIILFDRGLLVTDMERRPADYERMGMPLNERSLHFTQADGFVHALDLRTQGRSPVQNWLTSLSFRTMGFNTLRHVGTADHLHVSLPLN